MTTILDVQGVSKSFGGLKAVFEVSIDLEDGEILGIIGPNGAGKTTLFNMISGAIPADSGSITFDTTRIEHMKPHDIAGLGLVRTFQVVKPFAGLTIHENVLVGAFLRRQDPNEADEQAHKMMELTGLTPYAERSAQDVTLAIRKRLELARALATDPKVLLLDEVLAGLTPTEGVEMIDVVRSIRDSGVSVLIIEHVMAAIMALSDRIAVIHHGELLAIGVPASIVKDPRVVEAYLGEEFQIAPD
ncbi:MAG: ABC transporter ATP-binding protein [Actinomycetia bacterium]|nr:ABC transporter ATP-binding protein [Actinomycetes bacterium]